MTMAHTLRVLIADDELLARQRLEDMCATVPGIEIVAQVASGAAAIAAIREYGPDLVLLDVQMPEGTGLQVVQAIGPAAMPVTIFITAHDKYAVAAFESAAIDYLLKPFSEERFIAALQRARQTLLMRSAEGVLASDFRKALAVLENVAPPQVMEKKAPEYLKRIAIQSLGQVKVIRVEDVDFIGASGVYSEIHSGGKTYLLRESMQSLETKLDPKQFFRAHRSVIVQFDCVDTLLRQAGSDYTLCLKNGVKVTVSRARVKALEHWMGVPTHDL